MGTFRTLTASDVRGLLEAFGIEGYRAHAPIAAGTINTNLAVDTAEGRFFVRVNEGKARADVEREAAIVFHLAAGGVPTPAPRSAKSGEPFARLGEAYVSVFPWVEGRVLRRPALRPTHAHQAGQALARLHRAGADLPDHRPGRYEADEIQRRLSRITAAAQDDDDPALREAVAVLEPELAALAGERRADLPAGLIHGDLFIDNVLYGAGGQLTALLDFEQASWGPLAYDLAVSLLAFGFGQDDFDLDKTRAFLDGYAMHRRLEPVEREGFGAELRFACCRFAVTRITDVYLRRGDGAPGGKDFGRYLLRLRRVRERLASGDDWWAAG